MSDMSSGLGDVVRRREVLRAVLERARATGDVAAPWVDVPGVRAHFSGPTDVLLALHQEWVRRLVARLHGDSIVATRTPGHLQDVFRELSERHATLRAVLDANAGHPGLRRAQRRELAMLASITSLPDAAGAAQVVGSSGGPVRPRIPAQRAATT